MHLIAYALREEYAGTINQAPEGEPAVEVPVFQGGVVNVGDRRLDLRAELDAAPVGLIAVSAFDSAAIVALDGITALRRVALDEDAERQLSEDVYDRMKHPALVAEAQRRELDVPGNATNEALRAALRTHDTEEG